LVFIQFRKQCRLSVHQRLAGFRGNLRVRLYAPIATNVQKLMSMLSQYASHEQPPVAMRGIFLATKQRDAKFRNSAFQPRNSCDEYTVRRHSTVEHMTLRVVILGPFRTPTEFGTKKQIANSRSSQAPLQKLAVKLRRKARIGRRPRIDYHLNVVIVKQFGKFLAGMRGVSDCVDSAHRRFSAKHSTGATQAAPQRRRQLSCPSISAI
jgi:hypothetical protein